MRIIHDVSWNVQPVPSSTEQTGLPALDIRNLYQHSPLRLKDSSHLGQYLARIADMLQNMKESHDVELIDDEAGLRDAFTNHHFHAMQVFCNRARFLRRIEAANIESPAF